MLILILCYKIVYDKNTVKKDDYLDRYILNDFILLKSDSKLRSFTNGK
jgi:hypothetical protein